MHGDIASSSAPNRAQAPIAFDDLIDLIEGDAWRARGFDSVNNFIAATRLDRDPAPPERRLIAMYIKQQQPSVGNRAIARLLGSSEPTIRRDVAPPPSTIKASAKPASNVLTPKATLLNLSAYAESEEEARLHAWCASVDLHWAKDRTGYDGQIELDISATCATPAEARARTYALLRDLIAALSKISEEDFAFS